MKYLLTIFLIIVFSSSVVIFRPENSYNYESQIKTRTPAEEVLNTHTIKKSSVESNFSSDFDYYTAILEIQIEADKENGVYISDDETEKSFKKAKGEFALINPLSSHSVIESYIDHSDEGIEWSRAVAKYRFSNYPDERLDLIRTLLSSATADGYFDKTEKFLDCTSNTVIYDDFEYSGNLLISFHSSVSLEGPSFYVTENKKE